MEVTRGSGNVHSRTSHVMMIMVTCRIQLLNTSSSLFFLKTQNGLPYWCHPYSGYPEKKPLIEYLCLPVQRTALFRVLRCLIVRCWTAIATRRSTTLTLRTTRDSRLPRCFTAQATVTSPGQGRRPKVDTCQRAMWNGTGRTTHSHSASTFRQPSGTVIFFYLKDGSEINVFVERIYGFFNGI